VYEVGGHEIHCNNGRGHGKVTVKEAIARSCNVAMMKIAAKVGAATFSTEQSAYNFGLKTNIDLSGEARTVGLVFDETMGSSDLATNSFGQNFNATMIQMISGFSALVNGGYYYEPHMISRIETTSGAVVENIEPKLLKQIVSEETSAKIVEYCNATVTDGTGKSARPAGYAIGGKTGTAQTLPRGNGEYIVSFMGYAPADNPQIAIYVVVDRANVEEQDNSRLAQGIARNILTEVLPYLNIYMTEPLSEAEELELQQLKLQNTYFPSEEEGQADQEQGDLTDTEQDTDE
jgi:stage V sporulation protein D (sporulation-specific penicillin-binding protein)